MRCDHAGMSHAAGGGISSDSPSVYPACMALTTKERRLMKQRYAGLRAEIGARFLQNRHDTESLQQIIHLRKVEAAISLALAVDESE